MTVGSCKVFAFRDGDGIRQEAFADARAAVESKASKRRRNRQHDWRVWPTDPLMLCLPGSMPDKQEIEAIEES